MKIPNKFNRMGISVTADEALPPLTFTADTSYAQIRLIANGANDVYPSTDGFYYRTSKDGEWLPYTIGTIITTNNVGEMVQFQNLKNTLSISLLSYIQSNTISGKWIASGNIMSMLNYQTSCNDYCFAGFFKSNTFLISAPELPAMTLAQGCYYQMFMNCKGLTKFPDLPAMTLARNCYGGMFSSYDYDGTFIQPMAVLPATTLANSCYYQMFSNNKKIQKAPELPATTLASGCYDYMFSSCNQLKQIKVGFESWSGTWAWVNNVPSGGTFYKPSALPEQYASNKIPSGWTVVNID